MAVSTYSQFIQEPLVKSMIVLIQALDLKITKASILSDVERVLAGKSALGLLEVQHILGRYSIDSSVVQISTADLKSIEPPFLIASPEDPDTCCVVMQRGDDKWVYTPLYGTQPIADTALLHGEVEFLSLLIDAYEEYYQEPDYYNKNLLEKQEVLKYKNSIRIINHFLSPAECDELIAFCESNGLFRKSKIEVSREEGVIAQESMVRTSYSTMLNPKTAPHLARIDEKISNLLGKDASHLERWHCTRYGPGQEFKLHFDSFDDSVREQSVIVYLNDEFTGGETYFPEVNEYKITPTKGTCVIFTNLNEDRSIIPFSLHSSLPVQQGKKYIITTHVWNTEVSNQVRK